MSEPIPGPGAVGRVIPTPWQCPECGGPWLRNYVFRHTPNQCTILQREDATQAADAQRLASISRYTRPATAAEVLLLKHLAGPAAAADEDPQTVVSGSPALRHRVINEFDPDKHTI